MFENAINAMAEWTRPIHFVRRTYGGNDTVASAATLFFVNENGDAITCKHVGELLRFSQSLPARYQHFIAEVNSAGGNSKQRRQLIQAAERKHGFSKGAITHLLSMIPGVSAASPLNVQHIPHPTADLEILRFQNAEPFLYKGHAVFLKDTSKIMQGNYLCRLGFPFAEFTNFHYDSSTDALDWTSSGNPNTPRFPIDGMMTRFIVDSQGTKLEIELTTPGLMGMSGGPLFDADGIVYGMQFVTKHAHLEFDFQHRDQNNNATASIYPFMHLGRCVHVDVIKSFLGQNGITFSES